jgi:hypothetical protein
MKIETVEQLDDALSTPPASLIESLAQLEGDILVLGVAGKMGPTLARMAKRASDLAGVDRRVIGVARFSNPTERQKLEEWGIDTIKADLLDENAVATLPDAQNIVFMAGMKFGATGSESLTWAMNAVVPAIVASRYRDSRIAAFSTGNVYGLVPVSSGGSVETDSLNPTGEYAMSCLGRERVFELQSHARHADVNHPSELRVRIALRRPRRPGDKNQEQPTDRRDDGIVQRYLAGRRQRSRAGEPCRLRHPSVHRQRHRGGDSQRPNHQRRTGRTHEPACHIPRRRITHRIAQQRQRIS